MKSLAFLLLVGTALLSQPSSRDPRAGATGNYTVDAGHSSVVFATFGITCS